MASPPPTEYGALHVYEPPASSQRTSYKLLLGLAATATVATAAVMSTTPSAAPAPEPTRPLHVVESVYGAAEQVRRVPHASFRTSVTPAHGSYIAVDTTQVFQEIQGFGGAFTEAAALHFHKLSPKVQAEILRLYFDAETGVGYTIGRVPMNSCDFSPASYSFAEVANDSRLENFDMNVTHDQATIIPFLHAAQAVQPALKLFLSPWSPPAWMKLPDAMGQRSMTSSVEPNGLDPAHRATWAHYFSKFISGYKAQGLPFWGLTPQNEPLFAAPWEACLCTAQAQADSIAGFLGPQLRTDHPEVKIMVYDFIRDAVTDYASVNYAHASEYVDGVATHWYTMGGRELDGVKYLQELNVTHHVDPTNCNCPNVATGTDAWFRGQRYAHDILGNLNNWAVGWVDWNLMLDHNGGPNHLANTCDAPLILTPDEKSFTIQPMYYFIKHFSRYVPPGSHRVGVEVHAKIEAPGAVNLYTDYPAGLYACDASGRQAWTRTADDKLQVTGTT
ncbi:glucosylceramidase [Achlya hypogyna]|uniref:Glucosylceramidase n=1 Tax=Achlya hypogyna TaxID=1202772 RepID=A0A1V9Z890_ACHHY|nr:glucosylceramidase [Achlya hypogyna]